MPLFPLRQICIVAQILSLARFILLMSVPARCQGHFFLEIDVLLPLSHVCRSS